MFYQGGSMLDNVQFRTKILQPALQDIDCYSKDAEELLVAIMAHESKGGSYVAQIDGDANSAIGVYQMEPFTYDTLWNTYLSNDAPLAARILNSLRYLQRPPSEHLVFNLKLSTIMTRVFFLRLPDVLPEKEDLDGIWSLYKKYYNSSKGSATKEEFVADYFRFIGKEQASEKANGKIGSKKSGQDGKKGNEKV
jgi:hypothetical protein